MTADSGATQPGAGTRPRPIVLIVIDGFGIGPVPADDAIAAANTPTWDALRARWPHSVLRASEDAVGLPVGQMGNSEVGHLNLGAGRPVLQDLPRIDGAIADGSFDSRPALLAACARAAHPGGRLHIVSLIGPGGVHANDRHLVALVELAARQGVPAVRIHALLDGRDTPPRSAPDFVADVERRLVASHPDARVATIGGRYYGMDRDQRHERTAKAYAAIVHGVGELALSAQEAIAAAHERGESDEFVLPTVIGDPRPIRPGDAILMFNFRSDRGRQLTEALASPTSTGFERRRVIAGLCPVATLTQYDRTLPVAVVLPPHDVVTPLARALSEQGASQFHCAETEKYPHVTFFLNGGREQPFEGEDRQMAPSPKVATYDLQPEMSAPAVADATIAAIASGGYDFVIVNFANCDMVGHSGDFAATVTAVETVDRELGRVVRATLAVGGTLLVTADHGNAEEMIDRATGGPMTSHTTNPVPCVLVSPPDGIFRYGKLPVGYVLSSLAPTILDLLGLKTPPEMTSQSLVRSN